MERPLQTLAKVVLLHEAPCTVVPVDQQIDEIGVELVPSGESVLSLVELPSESLMVYRPQVHGSDTVLLIAVEQRIEIWRSRYIHRRQNRDFALGIASNCCFKIREECGGPSSIMGALPFMGRPIAIQRRADERVFSAQESPSGFFEVLQVRADDKLRAGKPGPAEITNRFQQIQSKERFPALELDLDSLPFDCLEEGKYRLLGIVRPSSADASRPRSTDGASGRTGLEKDPPGQGQAAVVDGLKPACGKMSHGAGTVAKATVFVLCCLPWFYRILPFPTTLMR